MKEYLNQLRWLLWAAVLLPLIQTAFSSSLGLSVSISGRGLLGTLLYFGAFIALYVLAGRRASQAGYSLAKSSFAGPIILCVNNLVLIPLRCITMGPYLQTGDHPAWVGYAAVPLVAILGLLVVFPIALGLAALGAHLHRKRNN